MLDPVLQCAAIGDYQMNGFPVPRAMIGQHENYGVPAQTGPKVFSGGALVMLDIGAGKPQRVYVDKTQEWLMSQVKQDSTGAWMDLSADILGAFEAVDDYFVSGIAWFEERPALQIPRRAIRDSGIIKNVTAAKVAFEFCFRCPDRFTDSTQPWLVVVTVRDEAGVVVSGATVDLMQVDPNNTTINNQPINQSLVTDVNGQGTFWVEYYLINQLMAYKTGSPVKTGLSLYTSQGGATITLFIKDPTTGGGTGIMIPTVGNTGLVRVA
jgi:hypothetical protein